MTAHRLGVVGSRPHNSPLQRAQMNRRPSQIKNRVQKAKDHYFDARARQPKQLASVPSHLLARVPKRWAIKLPSKVPPWPKQTPQLRLTAVRQRPTLNNSLLRQSSRYRFLL